MANRTTHIKKPNVNSTVEHITHVKGVNVTGEVFTLSVAEVINYLKQSYQFHVLVDGYRVAVTHQTSASGNEYIKTKPDATKKDNLLSLPQF